MIKRFVKIIIQRGEVILKKGLPINRITNKFPKLYEIAVLLRACSFVKPGNLAVQVELILAKKKQFSNALILSHAVKRHGHVIAIEPNNRNVDQLTKYVKDHNVNNITIIHKAVWKGKRIYFFALGKESWWSMLEAVSADINESQFINRVIVDTDTLDNILKSELANDIEKISYICLTVNGAE